VDIDTDGLLDAAGQLTAAAAELGRAALPTPLSGLGDPGLAVLCAELALLAARMAAARQDDVSALVTALRETARVWEFAENSLAATPR
jgi:hypothetical protein